MIYPDFDVNHPHGKEPEGMTHLQYLEKQYKIQLANSALNKAINKQYVPKCFYRHPAQCAKNPLIINAREISRDHQILLGTTIHDDLSQVGLQSTIHLQCICDSSEFSVAQKYGLQLGRLLLQRNGQYHVRDKPVSRELCKMMKISYGFDGYMYAIG